MKWNVILIFFLCFYGMSLVAQQQDKEDLFSNSVMQGDFPDPTIIRAGNTYYAAGTTSDFAPHYPLDESTDLINCKHTTFPGIIIPEYIN